LFNDPQSESHIRHLREGEGGFMQSKLLSNRSDRTWILVFGTGEEPVSAITEFAANNGLHGSHFTAIGAFQAVTLAYFDWQSKEYRKIPVREQVEVLSLIGDIALKEDGRPQVHAHVVVGLSDGATRGGHLMEARVRPTLEVVLVDAPNDMRRKHDPESGLALIDLSAGP
jgi:predicted DNA-binding protein with PD1-like motif